MGKIVYNSLYLSSRERAHENQWLSGLGLILILFSVFWFDKTTPFPSLYALVPVIGVVLIILFAGPATPTARLLSLAPLVGIGLISYSAYLWHQPLFAFARLRSIGEPGPLLLAFLSLASLGLGYLTWRFVERPFRDRQLIGRRRIFIDAISVGIVLAVIGAAGDLSSGFENRSLADGSAFGDLRQRFRPNQGLSRVCEGQFTLSPKCATSAAPEILVWGDSYAMQFVAGIVASKPDVKLIQMTKSFCGPVFDLAPIQRPVYGEKWARGCLAFGRELRQWLRRNQTVKYAALASPFSQYLSDGARLLDNNGQHGPDPALLKARFEATLAFLLRQGIKPVIFVPPPQDGRNIGACLIKSKMFAGAASLCDIDQAAYLKRRARVIDFLKDIGKRHKVVWLDPYLCDGRRYKASEGAVLFYRDVGHLTYEGVRHLGRRLNFYRQITQ